MSWKIAIQDDRVAEYADVGGHWHVCCRIDRPELGLRITKQGSPRDSAGKLPSGDRVPRGAVSLIPPSAIAVAEDQDWAALPRFFPEMSETYFRGDDCVAIFPQGDHDQFGMMITYRIVEASASVIVVETIMAIETTLLDTLPMVDVVIQGESEEIDPLANPLDASSVIRPGELRSRPLRAYPLPAAAWKLKQLAKTPKSEPFLVLFLPSSDRAAAGVIDQHPSGTRLRLLAEFLEKGVIRKARCWLAAWDREPKGIDLERCYARLEEEPLPLTP